MNDLIEQLKADPNLYAERPDANCGRSFPLRKAVVFYVEGLISDNTQKIIASKKQDIDEQRQTRVKMYHSAL